MDAGITNEVELLRGEPTWEIAELFPSQGNWSVEEYLTLPGNRLVEYSHGIIEVLPMPSYAHQLIVMLLYRLLYAFTSSRRLGVAIVAPFRVRLWEGKYLEPDVVFMLEQNRHRTHDQSWDGADLVMEVVSPDDPGRDIETKHREYAQAGIPEFWLVNPIDETITVFTLPEEGKSYLIPWPLRPHTDSRVRPAGGLHSGGRRLLCRGRAGLISAGPGAGPARRTGPRSSACPHSPAGRRCRRGCGRRGRGPC